MQEKRYLWGNGRSSNIFFEAKIWTGSSGCLWGKALKGLLPDRENDCGREKAVETFHEENTEIIYQCHDFVFDKCGILDHRICGTEDIDRHQGGGI